MKKIRTTIVVECEYDNELMNYGYKLRNKVLEKLNEGEFGFKVETGKNLPNPNAPITVIE